MRKKPRKRLSDACRAYGIEGWERIDKDGNRQGHRRGPLARIRPRSRLRLLRRGRAHVGAAAARSSYAAIAALLPAADVARVLHWSNYSAKAIALIQARGMPIDMPLWNLVQENKPAVIGELLRQFDPSHGSDDPIYTPDGEWSYDRFERWLVSSGVPAWPRLDSGKLDIDSDAFRLMYHVPGIEGLHALRDSLGFIAKARLPIGRDGRNRPSLFPFGTATGRNAHAKSPYNAHAGVRRSWCSRPTRSASISIGERKRSALPPPLSGDAALNARLSRRRRLSRARPALRPHRRSRSGALEETTPGRCGTA